MHQPKEGHLRTLECCCNRSFTTGISQDFEKKAISARRPQIPFGNCESGRASSFGLPFPVQKSKRRGVSASVPLADTRAGMQKWWRGQRERTVTDTCKHAKRIPEEEKKNFSEIKEIRTPGFFLAPNIWRCVPHIRSALNIRIRGRSQVFSVSRLYFAAQNAAFTDVFLDACESLAEPFARAEQNVKADASKNCRTPLETECLLTDWARIVFGTKGSRLVCSVDFQSFQ